MREELAAAAGVDLAELVLLERGEGPAPEEQLFDVWPPLFMLRRGRCFNWRDWQR